MNDLAVEIKLRKNAEKFNQLFLEERAEKTEEKEEEKEGEKKRKFGLFGVGCV